MAERQVDEHAPCRDHEVSSGQTVFVSTKGADDDHTLLGGGVVADHLYYVDHAQPDGKIVLANPWGAEGLQGLCRAHAG